MAKRRRPPAGAYGAQLLDNPQGERRERSPAEEEARKYKHWMDEITAAKKVFKPYWERGRKILKLYKDERKEMGEVARANDRMNILWSNVETLKPAMYSKTPTPNVSRRFMDGDPVSRTASTILERCLITAIDLADFDYPMQRATLDYLLPGRGTVWVRYAPQMGMAPMREPLTRIDLGGRQVYRPYKGGEEIDAAKVKKDDDGLEYYETEPEEQVLAHGLDLDHLMWSDYMHEPVNDWTKVGWQCKRVDMKRPRLIKEFGEEKGRKVKLNKSFNAKPETEDSTTEKGKPDCAEVYEIWSKDHRKVCWISDGLPDELLKEQDDPLRLHDFWPLPRPIFATLTTDSLIPVPDYALYQDQAEQLDRITDRIRLLIQALRVVGVYNAEMASLQTLLDETSENEMVPVENWITFAQQGGLKGLIDWLPIEQISTVLAQLFTARAQIKQDLYEVTGISDVIRGATAPEETATAQQIKANFGNLRLQARQTEMARFARDTIRKMAEIIAEHFPPEELIEMSGVMSLDEFRVKPEDFKPESDDPQAIAAAQQAMAAKAEENKQKLQQAIALIKSDKLRTFKIDIETDATVAPDQQKEKEARVEFLTAVAPFIEKAALVGQQAPQLVPLLMKMLDFGVKGFRAGRSLENAIEETIALTERMQAEAQAKPQDAPADPEAEAAAAKLTAETEKLKAELTALQAEAAVKAEENKAKAIENQRRADEQRQLFNQQMLKLTEDIAFRKQENTKRLQELDASIRLKELQVQQLEAQTNADFVSNMDPQQPPASPVDDANAKAALAKAQVDLIDAQTRYAELVKRGQGLDGISDALGGLPEADPSKIGTPAFARKKGPKKKLVDFIRDPETNQIKGATIDEIELPPDEEDAA
jgi:hypothetical protein